MNFNLTDILMILKKCSTSSVMLDKFPSKATMNRLLAAIQDEELLRYVVPIENFKGLFAILKDLINNCENICTTMLLSRILCIVRTIVERQNVLDYDLLFDSHLVSTFSRAAIGLTDLELLEDCPGLFMDIIILCPKKYLSEERFDLLSAEVVQLLLKLLRALNNSEHLLHALMALNLLMEISVVNGNFSIFNGDFMLGEGPEIINNLKKIKACKVSQLAADFMPRFSELNKTLPGQRTDRLAIKERHASTPNYSSKKILDDFSFLNF